MWIVMGGLGIALADPTPLAANQSPCSWLQEELDKGLDMPSAIALAEEHQAYFTNRDILCLRRAGVHRRIWEAARGASVVEELQGAALVAGDAAGERREERRANFAVVVAAAEEEHEKQRLADEEARLKAMEGRYTIELVSVIIAPAKSNGALWDGFSTVDPALTSMALNLIVPGVAAVPGSDEVAGFFANAAAQGTNPPDVFGYAQLSGPNAPPDWQGLKLSLRSPDNPLQDSYVSNFPGSPGFRNVLINDGDRVRITLYDADLTEKDLVGTFDIGATEIIAASSITGTAEFQVAEQTSKQVLSVRYAVYPANEVRPSIQGTVFR